MHRQTKERKMQMNSQWKCIFEPINHFNVSSSSGHFFFFLLSLTFFSSAFISISTPFFLHLMTSFPLFLNLSHYLFEAWLDHIYIRLLRLISISSIFLSKSLFSLSKLFRFGSIHTTATSFLTLSPLHSTSPTTVLCIWCMILYCILRPYVRHTPWFELDSLLPLNILL